MNCRRINLIDILGSSAAGRTIALKLIDHTFGWLLAACLRPWCTQKSFIPPNVRSILIIRPGGIGDAVWILPLIRTLNTRSCVVDVLCERRNKAVFDLIRPQVRHLWTYDGDQAILKNLKANAYDAVIDTEQYHHFSAIFACLTKCPVRIGFDTAHMRSGLYTHTVSYSHDEQEYRLFLKLFNVLSPISEEKYKQHMFLDVSGIDRPAINVDRPFIAVYIGASVRERFWGVDQFAGLCSELIANGYDVVLVGGKEDMDKSTQIQTRIKGSAVMDLVGKANLTQTTAVLTKANVVVGADSGIMHLACAAGCKAVWLFGAGIEKKWLPQFGRNESINVHVPCSPCTVFGYTPRCPYDVRCLKQISVPMVLERVLTAANR